ncbi:MAG TPA: hypothetical protein DCZ95_03630 [Verrucomicrobia bacterium]|nr:MAG: hypothetical protein A2X46_01335 [Lentisphaerae bacterium GWF2_57_35]HBA83165.1 hypothetical protein [Verrucomicrobiota bacterium]
MNKPESKETHIEAQLSRLQEECQVLQKMLDQERAFRLHAENELRVCDEQLKASEQREKSLQNRVTEARQMELLGKLAGVVAHELNNILVPVVGYPELIQNELPPDSPSREFLNLIGAAGKKAVAYISDLLALARQESPVFKPAQLNTAIQRHLESPDFSELKTQYPSVELDLKLTPNLPLLSGSYGRLNRILGNLLAYVFEISVQPCTLELNTCREEAPSDSSVGSNKSFVVFRLRNPSIEMAADEMAKIFEPFYIRNRTCGSANGLSLAAVYVLVKEQKGRIHVHSAPGKGTEFVMRFPAAAGQAAPLAPKTHPLSGSGRILVVDDEQNTRDITSRFLKRLGYEVVTAENGHDAIRLYESGAAGSSFDVILMDMIMERGFDGLDTFSQIKELNPRQRCIITSGYLESDRVRQVLVMGAGQFLPKPYTLEQIGRAIRAEMERGT